LENALQRIRSVADYQFGKGVGVRLFPKDVVISYSRRTNRIRYVFLDGERLATMKPTDGLFSLSIEGAKRIAGKARSAKCFVKVRDDISSFISNGGDVFAAHVVQVSSEIRPKDEIIVVDDKDKVLAVGRAVLSGEEMRVFKRGVAVKIRRGCVES
jgi:predicted RNA-binding protein (TIGR00451 family)